MPLNSVCHGWTATPESCFPTSHATLAVPLATVTGEMLASLPCHKYWCLIPSMMPQLSRFYLLIVWSVMQVEFVSAVDWLEYGA